MQMHEVDQNPSGALTELLLWGERHQGETTPTDSLLLPETLNEKGREMKTNGMEAESRKGPDAEGYSRSPFPLKSIDVQKSKSFRETSS